MRTFRIRPHHVLCLNNFISKGYCDEFSKNMAQVKKALESDANTKVVIAKGCDDICSLCPHRIGQKCDTDDKVISFDKNALKVLEICENCCYSWSELCDKFYEKIVLQDRLNDVCGECCWKNICEKQVENKNN